MSTEDKPKRKADTDLNVKEIKSPHILQPKAEPIDTLTNGFLNESCLFLPRRREDVVDEAFDVVEDVKALLDIGDKITKEEDEAAVKDHLVRIRRGYGLTRIEIARLSGETFIIERKIEKLQRDIEMRKARAEEDDSKSC